MSPRFYISLLLFFSVFNICYDTSSARAYDEGRKFRKTEKILRNDKHDFPSEVIESDYEGAKESAAVVNDNILNQNLDEANTEDNYFDHKRNKLSPETKNNVNANDNLKQEEKKKERTSRLINIDIDAPNVELDDIDEIKINRNVKKHSDKKEPSTESKHKTKPKKYRFPFFSKNIYFNKTEEFKPVLKKTNKQRFINFDEDENMADFEHSEKDNFNTKLEDDNDSSYSYNADKVNKRYMKRLCPECKRKFILKSENSDRLKRGCHSFIHNSRQFFQLNPDSTNKIVDKANETRVVVQSENEPKQVEKYSKRNSELESDYLDNVQKQKYEIIDSSKKERQFEELNEIQKTIDNVKIYENPKKYRRRRRIWDSNRIEMQRLNTYCPKYIQSDSMDYKREQDRLIRELNEIEKQVDEVDVKIYKKKGRKKRFYTEAEKQRQLDELENIEDRISSMKTPSFNFTTVHSRNL